jgi:hypothetical protein
MNKLKAIGASWLRSFLAAALATYSIQGLNYKAMLTSGVAALLPVALRYLNPKDSSFGIGS